MADSAQTLYCPFLKRIVSGTPPSPAVADEVSRADSFISSGRVAPHTNFFRRSLEPEGDDRQAVAMTLAATTAAAAAGAAGERAQREVAGTSTKVGGSQLVAMGRNWLQLVAPKRRRRYNKIIFLLFK